MNSIVLRYLPNLENFDLIYLKHKSNREVCLKKIKSIFKFLPFFFVFEYNFLIFFFGKMIKIKIFIFCCKEIIQLLFFK